MSDEVRVETYDQIVEITIDRPPANAINPGVSNAIYAALSMLQQDDDLRVGIITGSGERIFSAGWDLKEIAAIDNNEEAVNSAYTCPGGFAGISEFWGLKKPVICTPVSGVRIRSDWATISPFLNRSPGMVSFWEPSSAFGIAIRLAGGAKAK